MRGTSTTRWGLLLLTSAALGGLAGAGVAADGPDALRPARRIEGPTTLARVGEQALERLPWEQMLVRTHVNAGRPTAVAAAYLMSQDLLIIEENGRITCLARRDLQPKWKWTLSGSLHRPPAEGPDHYVFLTRGATGSFGVHALSRRTGVDTTGFPVRLPYGVSGGVAANGAMVFISALGSAYDNKTLTTLNLATGRPGWGWYTTGLLNADPVVDSSGKRRDRRHGRRQPARLRGRRADPHGACLEGQRAGCHHGDSRRHPRPPHRLRSRRPRALHGRALRRGALDAEHGRRHQVRPLGARQHGRRGAPLGRRGRADHQGGRVQGHRLRPQHRAASPPSTSTTARCSSPRSAAASPSCARASGS